MFGSLGLLPFSYMLAGVVVQVGLKLLFVGSGVTVMLSCGLVATRRALWKSTANTG